MIVNNNKYFSASYAYGPKEEQLVKLNFITNFFQTTIVRPFKFLIYPCSSFLRERIMNSKRLVKAKNELIAVGGQTVKMQTPDGDLIDGMFLDTNEFRKNLDKYFYLEEKENEETIDQKLILRKKFIEEKHYQSGPITRSVYSPNQEAELFINRLKELGIKINEEGQEKNVIHLETFPNDLPIADNTVSQPTVIICPGAAICYAAYKNLAIEYLMKGINVMMFDYRGYGKSKGSPTEEKTKLDLETAYQYLSKEKQIQNNDIMAHGHCLGGGPAVDLAARRKGVNLILDRSFAEYREVAKDRIPAISKLIYKLLPGIVNYNIGENLRKVKGHIAIEMALKDDVISDEQKLKQLNSLPNPKNRQIFKPIYSDVDHTGQWTEDSFGASQLNDFLEKTNLRRRLF